MVSPQTSIRKWVLRGIALVTTLILAGCQVGGFSSIPTASGPSIRTNAPVPVALLVPGGSERETDTVLAKSLENAARLAVDDLSARGVTIDLRVYNTAGDEATGAAAAVTAVNEGAKVIVGPLLAGVANAAGVAVARANVNVLTFSNNADIAGNNVFVLGSTFDNTARRLVRFAERQGLGAIMIAHEQNTVGQVGRRAVERALSETGRAPAAIVGYPFTPDDVVSAAPAIAAAATDSGARALFLTADSAGALPLLATLLPENGLDPAEVRTFGLTRWDVPRSTLSLPGVQGGFFALPDRDLTERFSARYQAAYGSAPHLVAGLAYDGIAAIGALVASGRRDALTAEALTQPSGFIGVNGVFRLLPDGTNERALDVAQVQNGEMVIVSPAPTSFAATGF